MVVLNKIDSLLSNLLQDDKLDEDLYHYTPNLGSLVSILKERKLRMVLDKNGEISESMRVLCERIKHWKINLKYPHQQLNTFEGCLKYYVKQLRFFTLSFTLSEDHPELWRSFGGEGYGFCIRFDKDYFIEKPYSWDRNIPFNGIMKISYGKEALHSLADATSEILNQLYILNDPGIYWNYIIEIYLRLIPQLPKSLHECYNVENEYRLYTQDIGIQDEYRISDDLIKSDEGRRDEKGYFYLLSDPFSLGHIKEILIGAKNNFEKTKNEIFSELEGCYSKEELDSIIIKKSEA